MNANSIPFCERATSPEVIAEYRRRYGGTASVIASSMAGQAVQRPAELAVIGTTSLYGQRPSQYDRISVPVAVVEGAGVRGEESGVGKGRSRAATIGDGESVCGAGRPGPVRPTLGAVRYEYLGRTRGLGTFQFGDATVAAMQELLRQSKNGLQVNSVFGEGVNPRLRKIRDALGELGLPADEVLEHGTPRLVYGVALAENTREHLLGRAKRLKYLLAQGRAREASRAIAEWWIERWMMQRVGRQEVVERIAGQTLVHPIRHGARVVLPVVDGDQGRLFET